MHLQFYLFLLAQQWLVKAWDLDFIQGCVSSENIANLEHGIFISNYTEKCLAIKEEKKFDLTKKNMQTV